MSESDRSMQAPGADAAASVAAPARGPEQRRSLLARLAGEVFDVLVIGGGVTGCGVALDAASRGLSVAMLEKRDWAAGTSSRSSKLIHGGLRYLEQLDIELVCEALHERRLLSEKIAPHLVHPTPILFPGCQERCPGDGSGARLGRGCDRARDHALPGPAQGRKRCPGPARRRRLQLGQGGGA